MTRSRAGEPTTGHRARRPVVPPELDLHVRFDTPGAYRLWAQFRLADGRVITAPFTVTAS